MALVTTTVLRLTIDPESVARVLNDNERAFRPAHETDGPIDAYVTGVGDTLVALLGQEGADAVWAAMEEANKP